MTFKPPCTWIAHKIKHASIWKQLFFSSGQDRKKNQTEKRQADRDANAAENPREVLHPARRRLRFHARQSAESRKPGIFGGPLLPKLVFAHSPCEDHQVHGKLFRPNVAVEKMDGKDKPRGQQSLFPVNNQGHVEDPTGEKCGKKARKPEHKAGGPDDRHTPEDRPIIELLPVGKATERWSGPQAQEPFEVAVEFFEIIGLRHQRVRAPQYPRFPAHEAAVKNRPEMEKKAQS